MPGSHYDEYVRLLAQLHGLIRDGRGDGAEADDLRDRMDDHWPHLDAAEVEQARALSAEWNARGRDSAAGLGETTGRDAGLIPRPAAG